MSGGSDFLFDKVLNNDLVLVDVVGAPRSQVLRAKVKKIYSAGKGIDRASLGEEIEFVQSGGAWGAMLLNVGARALLFVSRSASGGVYEDPWRGHMLVEEICGDLCAIFQHKELWLNQHVPSLIRDNARQDPKRSNATAIRFDVMESYLLSLIERAGR